MKAKITDVWTETHDVKTFRLKPEAPMPFIAGQYLILAIPELPGETRPFTFSNSPTDPHLEITVKRMHEFTALLHTRKPGDTVEIDGPFGEKLNFDESIREDMVFIAGGSGITPFMSIIRFWKALSLPNSLTLLYSSRSELDIIFKKELDSLGLEVVHTLTDSIPPDWKGETGRISREMVSRHIAEQGRKLWFVCGPPPMVQSVKLMLKDLGIPEERWRIEDWQLPGKHDKEV